MPHTAWLATISQKSSTLQFATISCKSWAVFLLAVVHLCAPDPLDKHPDSFQQTCISFLLAVVHLCALDKHPDLQSRFFWTNRTEVLLPCTPGHICPRWQTQTFLVSTSYPSTPAYFYIHTICIGTLHLCSHWQTFKFLVEICWTNMSCSYVRQRYCLHLSLSVQDDIFVDAAKYLFCCPAHF